MQSSVSDWNKFNVAARLTVMAGRIPDQIALASPLGSAKQGVNRPYKTVTFTQLELNTSSIAAGLQKLGIRPGMRIVMLVPFGADFITLVFALLKIEAVIVLVDPGMGRRNLLSCIQATEPDGFIAIPMAHAIRAVLRRRFPKARFNVTVGPTLGVFPQPSLKQLLGTPPSLFEPPATTRDSQAAIIFTTGSTGPPKGVLYTHHTFNSQVDAIAEHYGILPGGKDLSGFPLFGLFNAAMGTTTVIPDMDPTRPADVDPPRLLDAIEKWKINQAFGSPALWTAVSRFAQTEGRKIPHLQRILSAGAPVSPDVLEAMRGLLPAGALMHTPYGATEALPIASIDSQQVLSETAALTRQGAGTCVGSHFAGIQWKVIAIDDGPLATLDRIQELPVGKIGELMVTGDVVTRQYVTRTDQNAFHKVLDGERVWHRLGDVGYLDGQDRFWYCGRKAHRVTTDNGQLFTEQCEAIFNQHPSIYRSALVGVGHKDHQTPVIIVEPLPQFRPKDSVAQDKLLTELRTLGKQHALTQQIERFLVYPRQLPTDIRHNSKIFREQLVPWATKQLQRVDQLSSQRK
ncbi:MAG: AMP-binding protein [Pirellulaceae bacterium]|nr:AMP-binding protein [Pirellulaceae bacterium]